MNKSQFTTAQKQTSPHPKVIFKISVWCKVSNPTNVLPESSDTACYIVYKPVGF